MVMLGDCIDTDRMAVSKFPGDCGQFHAAVTSQSCASIC